MSRSLRYAHIRPGEVEAHGACEAPGCRLCQSTADLGAWAVQRDMGARRTRRRARARRERRARHGPAITPGLIAGHAGCGEPACALCRASGEPALREAARSWARRRGRGEDLALADLDDPAGGGRCSQPRQRPSSPPCGTGCGCSEPSHPAAGALAAWPGPDLEDVPQVEPGPFDCSLCPPPDTPTLRETVARLSGGCPDCAATDESLVDLAWAHGSWYFSGAVSAGDSGTRSSPWPVSRAREILGRRAVYPGASFLFDASAGLAPELSGEAPPGHEVEANSPCWASWEQRGEAPTAFLVVRASGTATAPLLLAGYAGPGTGGGPFSGRDGPTVRASSTRPSKGVGRAVVIPGEEGALSGPADAADADPTPGLDPWEHPEGVFVPGVGGQDRPGLVELDGGWRCEHARRADTDAGETEAPGPGHDLRFGLLFEDVCQVEVQDFAVKGFETGIVVLGDCRDLVFRHLKVYESLRSGMRCRGCPELFDDDAACVAQFPLPGAACTAYEAEIPAAYPYGGQCSNNKAPYLTVARGYPSRVEITRCLFMDNGATNTSTGAQLSIQDYCTNFHVHHCLFCMSAFGRAWREHWPPLPTLALDHDPGGGVPDSTVTEAGSTDCAALLVEMVDTCCASGAGTCGCGTLPGSQECQDAAARVKLCRGFQADPYREGGCFRWAGDGITFELASSGHVVERCTFVGIHAQCGRWSRPQALHASAEGCTDQSDGDGIDLKGLRVRTPDVDRPFTVIRHCLFLFNEGPAIQAINGTQGLEIYRNVVAGNGMGIKLDSGDNVHSPDEWTCTDTSTSPSGAVTESIEWTELGCYRVYRNLIYRNDMVDACYSGEGTGIGAGILVDLKGPLGALYNTEDPVTKDAVRVLERDRATRMSDIWLVSNTIVDNPGGGITVTRPQDCLMEQYRASPSGSDFRAIYPYPQDGTGDGDVQGKFDGSCAHPDEQLAALVRITELHILDNLLVANGTGGGADEQLNAGAGTVQWVGQAGNHFINDPGLGVPSWNPELHDHRVFPEVFRLDGNLYYRTDEDGKVARYSFDQATFSDLVEPFGHEQSWDGVEYSTGTVKTAEVDQLSRHNRFWFDWGLPNQGFVDVVSPWMWQDDPDVGYAFEEDWGEVEPAWDVLPPEWNPQAYRPTSESLAARGGKAPSGIADHGLFSGACVPAPFDSNVPVVDVASDPASDWPYTLDFGCRVSRLHVGALAPSGIDASTTPTAPSVVLEDPTSRPLGEGLFS